MNNTLAEVWHQVERLLQDGISVIPVRDKDTDRFVAKSPYRDWKEYQSRIIEKEELWRQMEEHNTTAIATICGAVSGNMEVIDIDVKYKPGIDATLYQDIKSLFPELWERLRRHKSPSTGGHIIYRVEGHPVPGNLKLAGRPATDDELQHSKQKTYNFIETRGEGGFVLFPPSLGYSVAHDVPIPVITWEERCALIELCKSYTEIIKVEPTYKPSKTDNSYYDEDPFIDYNRRCDPVALIQNYGWNFYKENSKFIWFTRPGKDKGISASFNREKRIFFNFTASTELDEQKGYHPATLLAQLEFGGDKKRTYSFLVTNGYGKVKPQAEKAAIKSRALKNVPLPANFSQEAQQEHQQIIDERNVKHPYGIFWKENKDDKIEISRMGIYEVAEGMGYKLFEETVLVQVIGTRIYRRENRFFFDEVKSYIQEEDPELYEEVCNAYESFIERHGKFSISRLPLLDDRLILKDDAETAYKFYQNGYVKITAVEDELLSYDGLEKLVWDELVQRRDYGEGKPGGLYVDFIEKACANPEAVMPVLGYLAHQFKDETTGYIIVLTEEVPDPKNGGGSGKNIFSALLQYQTTYLNIPGSQVKYDEKFLQSWNYQRVMAISDVDKKFDFGFLKELATGSGLLKKLWNDETSVPVELMPKFIIQTNYSYEITDGGLGRRLIPVEFTNFFSLKGGVDVHYGLHFPKGWSAEDWIGYDAYYIKCIKMWLLNGRKLHAGELTESGWLKQFDQEFKGQLTREFIQENWNHWLRVGWISTKQFNEEYERFCVENGIPGNYRLTSQIMNRALQRWAVKHKIVFEPSVRKRTAIGEERGRQFSEEAPF